MVSISILPALGDEARFGDNTTFTYEEKTNGTGFFSTYSRLTAHGEREDIWDPYGQRLGTVSANGSAHGSGTVKKDDIIRAGRVAVTGYDEDYLDADYLYVGGGMRRQNWTGWISWDSSDQMSYSPTEVALGTGYYKSRPLIYDSQISERSCVKNYRFGEMINHEITYARSVEADQKILVYDSYRYFTVYNDSHENRPDVRIYQNSTTSMRFAEDVTGAIGIRALKAKMPQGYSTWTDGQRDHVLKRTRLEVDEDYTGAYQLERNITFSREDGTIGGIYVNWLPCCFGGLEDLRIGRYLSNDMTCFKCDS